MTMASRSCLLSCMVTCLLATADAQDAARPSVLWIVADDMSLESTGVYGNQTESLTPRIDRLAEEGLTFHEFHVNVAVCQPCRAVMLTGLWPHHNGARGFEPIAAGVRTLPARLREAGYRNGILGKTEHCRPEAAFAWDRVVPRSQLREGRSPERYAEEVASFLNGPASDAPFFLMVNAHDPHRPFPGSQAETRQRQRDKNPRDYPVVENPIAPEDVRVPGFLPDLPDVRREFAQYLTACRRFDAVVKAVLDVLDHSGRADDTLVIVTSDHGMPFPFAKTNCYEASSRVPFLVRWPGHVTRGRHDHTHMVSMIDLTPTILEACGLEADDALDGSSFVSLLRGEPQANRDRVFTCFYETSGKRAYPMRGVIERDTVYIWNAWADGETRFRNESQSGLTMKAMQRAAEEDEAIAARVQLFLFRQPEELYDRLLDPNALHDLSKKEGPRRNRLRATLLEHLRSTGDPSGAAFEAFVRSNP
ncbi:MAG: sulfatase [Planctomycetes bacterium]|nr:sulfatase [Planctomycetota bacterium]